jgi:hypothetical protein
VHPESRSGVPALSDDVPVGATTAGPALMHLIEISSRKIPAFGRRGSADTNTIRRSTERSFSARVSSGG